MMIFVSTFIKREGCLYIWLITSSFVEGAPNEWHETQAKIIHHLIVQQNLIKILRFLNEKEYDCPGSLPVLGSYYLVMYKGELWPRQVTQVKSGGEIVIVKCLEKANAPKWLTWKWPVKKDKHDYAICDVKNTTTATGWLMLNNFRVSELSHVCGKC